MEEATTRNKILAVWYMFYDYFFPVTMQENCSQRPRFIFLAYFTAFIFMVIFFPWHATSWLLGDFVAVGLTVIYPLTLLTEVFVLLSISFLKEINEKALEIQKIQSQRKAESGALSVPMEIPGALSLSEDKGRNITEVEIELDIEVVVTKL